ncbi:molybdopterin-dependent oxidoreductase [Aestuariispira insulae]|uniref:molybdopterin-dependent oxidoreductase n=1 Tax=Aestuariispira insulae TaxID=1461337 RepID=UPI0015F2A0B1|nr:molybdopterin-dependent oxidoreductase [Aestuariispira insulae]
MLSSVPSAYADHILPAAEGPVILTVTGNLQQTTDGHQALLDLALLESIGLTTIVTTTPWHQGRVKFEGVLVRDLMAHLGVAGRMATVGALNQYQADTPVADFLDHDVILALKANGNYLSVRDKGPVFIIYPFDRDENLRNETYFARSVWQVNSMRFFGDGAILHNEKHWWNMETILLAAVAAAIVLLAVFLFLSRARKS